MTDVNFVHPAGDVLLHDVEAKIADGRATISGTVTPDVWEHIENEDVFGARSRTRSGSIIGDGHIRLIITGPESATGPGSGPFARDWEIIDARRRLAGTADDEEAWIGATFGAPRTWTLAAAALTELGFQQISSNVTSASFVDDSGITVDVSADAEQRLAIIAIRTPIEQPSGPALHETLAFLNHLNGTFPVGTLTIDNGVLIAKSGIPIPEGVDVSEILEALAYGMPGLNEMVLEGLRPVVSGSIPATDAISKVLG
jgi:hypothetical protein